MQEVARYFCAAIIALACANAAMFAQGTPTAPAPAPPIAAPQLTEDEAAVYTALFLKLYEAAKGRPIVLSDQTALGVPPGMMANTTVEGPLTEKFLSRLPADARTEYEARNKQSLHFPSPCKLAPECVVANLADLAPYTKDARAWGKFFKKYPNSPGIVVVSRIGFNADHTEAVVYAGHSCGILCGQGEFDHLVKQDGAWAVSDRTIVWISEK